MVTGTADTGQVQKIGGMMTESDKASFDAMRAQNEKMMRKLEKVKNKMI